VFECDAKAGELRAFRGVAPGKCQKQNRGVVERIAQIRIRSRVVSRKGGSCNRTDDVLRIGRKIDFDNKCDGPSLPVHADNIDLTNLRLPPLPRKLISNIETQTFSIDSDVILENQEPRPKLSPQPSRQSLRGISASGRQSNRQTCIERIQYNVRRQDSPMTKKMTQMTRQGLNQPETWAAPEQ
jgi:hypothetical protein